MTGAIALVVAPPSFRDLAMFVSAEFAAFEAAG
jgi:hypothetical protein